MEEFADRCAPKVLDSFVGNTFSINKLRNSLINGENILLLGSTGSGKTTMVNLIVKDIGYSLWTLDTNSVTSVATFKKNVNEFLTFLTFDKMFSLSGESNSRSREAEKVVIFIDDLDVLVTCDKGVQAAFLAIVNTYSRNRKYVFVASSCNNNEKKLTETKKVLTCVRVNPLENHEVLQLINNICTVNSIHLDNSQKKQICSGFNSDVRSLIIRIGMFSTNSGSKNFNEILQKHDIGACFTDDDTENTFYDMTTMEVLEKVLQTDLNYKEMASVMNNDYNLVGLLIHENYPYELKNSQMTIDDVLYISNEMCVGDNVDFEMFKDLDWDISDMMNVSKITRINSRVMSVKKRPMKKTQSNTYLSPSYSFSNILTKMSLRHNYVKKLTEFSSANVFNLSAPSFIMMCTTISTLIKNDVIHRKNVNQILSKGTVDVLFKFISDFGLLDKNTIVRFKKYVR